MILTIGMQCNTSGSERELSVNFLGGGKDRETGWKQSCITLRRVQLSHTLDKERSGMPTWFHLRDVIYLDTCDSQGGQSGFTPSAW